MLSIKIDLKEKK